MKTVVTIGMVLRNCERLLGDAIDHIVDQDFPHELMEIIFVDDGSEDDTLKIISDYASRIDIKTKIFHTEWRGLGPARQTVVNNTDGDYITWVDADENLPRDYIEKQVAFMEQNPNVGITAGVVKMVPGNLVLNLELIPLIIDHARFEKRRSFIWKTERFQGTGGSTFRVKALKQIEGFDERIRGVGEDQDIARRVKDLGWLIRLNEAGFYELHGGMSTIVDLWKKYFWWGYGGHSLYRKNKRILSLPRMSPPAGFVAGFIYSLTAYELLHRKIVFILPFHYALKMTAWCFGFMRSQTS